MDDDFEFREMTKKHFDFLVLEYGFDYDEKRNMYEKNKIRITIEHWDRTVPSIMLWLKSEPKFTNVLLDRLLEEYINHKETDKLLMEESFKYYAKLFKNHAFSLIYELDSLLLTGLKRNFIDIMRLYGFTRQNYLQNIENDHRKKLDYIRKKDPKWDPFSKTEK